LFRLTLEGTARHTWDHTSAPVADGACTRTVRSEGIRTATFRTRRPVLVRVVEGRVLPVDVRGIAGTVSLGGANTTRRVCGEEGTEQIADCVTTRRSFAGAVARISSPRSGVIALGRVRGVGLRRVDCPLEVADVRRAPLGPVPGPLRSRALLNPGLRRLVLTGSKRQTTRFGAPEQGNLSARAEWTLTFVRVTE
jgi:hypothetical protein